VFDWSEDKRIGGWYWVDGWGTVVFDGDIDSNEMIEVGDPAVDTCANTLDVDGNPVYSGCTGEAAYSPWTDNTSYKELGSGNNRSFSDEFKEVILNTGFEFWYTESFVLRAGYIYDQEGDIKAPTFGAGLRFGGYVFDFHHLLYNQNQIHIQKNEHLHQKQVV
jgi:hypothetical protein